MSDYTKRRIKSVSLVAVIFVVVFAMQWFISTDFGVKRENITADFKEHEMITDLPVVSSIEKDAAGCIAWGENPEYSFRFGLYFKNGIYGYVYKMGGNIHYSPEKVKKFICTKNDCSVYVTVNDNHVAKMKIYKNRQEPEYVDINPNEPFVYTSPKGIHRVEFFDINGKNVEIERIFVD